MAADRDARKVRLDDALGAVCIILGAAKGLASPCLRTGRAAAVLNDLAELQDTLRLDLPKAWPVVDAVAPTGTCR